MQRVHITGCGPRTGTTLLAEVMIACMDIPAFCEHEERIFSRASREVEIYLSKHPSDILVVEPMLRLVPNHYVICMVRDPRDAIVSKHRLEPGRYWAGLRYWKAARPILERLADHPRFVTVRYEQLVSDPDAVQRQLEEQLPFLRSRHPFSRFHDVAKPTAGSVTALSGVRPIAPTSVGVWREHRPRVAGQLQIHGPINADLIAHGYEADDDWLAELEGVTADLSSSRWPEHFAWMDMARRTHGKHYRAWIRAAWYYLTRQHAHATVRR